MNIKREDIKLDECKPEIPNLYLNTDTPSILVETVKCEIKHELDEQNLNLEKDPLDIEESKFKKQNQQENIETISLPFSNWENEEEFNSKEQSIKDKDPLDIENYWQFENSCIDSNFKLKKCVICNKANCFNTHISNAHKGLNEQKCDLCDKAFITPGYLKTHIKIVHEKQRNHKCDLCEKAFNQPSELKIHINNVHEGLSPIKL